MRTWVSWEFLVDPVHGDGFYCFPVTLTNGSARWVDETIDDAVEGWTSTLTINLRHTSGS